MEQYRNSLYRSTKAYEIILNRELQYYEQLNLHLAELIPLVQDLVYYLKPNEYKNQIEQFEAYKKMYLRYLDLLLLLKNESLIFHLYTTKEIFQEVTSVIIQMQDDKHFWSEQGLLLNDKESLEINFEECECQKDTLLRLIASVQVAVFKRLKDLSE